MQNQNTIFCQNCGNQNESTNKFCLYCGTQLVAPPQNNNVQPTENIQPVTNLQQNQEYQNQIDVQQNEEKEVKLGFLGIAGFLSLIITFIRNIYSLIAVVVIVLFLYNNKGTKKLVTVILKVIGIIYVSTIILGLVFLGLCVAFINGLM